MLDRRFDSRTIFRREQRKKDRERDLVIGPHSEQLPGGGRPIEIAGGQVEIPGAEAERIGVLWPGRRIGKRLGDAAHF